MKKNVELVKQYFDALSKGDFASAGLLFADEIVCHQPGKSVVSGTFNGKEAVFAHLGRFMQLSQGTFAIDKVNYVTTNKDLVAVSIHFKATTGKISLSMNGIDLMRIEDDKIKEIWLFSENIMEEDKFWTTLSMS